MLRNAGTLAVELVVLGARELLGALGAVVAAAGAGGSAGESLSGCCAEGGSCGEHIGGGGVESACETMVVSRADDTAAGVWCEQSSSFLGLGGFGRFVLFGESDM